MSLSFSFRLSALLGRFVRIQWVLFVIITMGLITAFDPAGHSNGSVSGIGLAWLVLSTFITTFSGVFNARVLQRGKCSLHMQNILLYSQGFVLNLAMYMGGWNASGKGMKDQGFFYGYDNMWVVCVIVSQSFLGIVISAVYKYGDVIIKCLAVGVQAACLLVLDALLFGLSLNLQSIMGAGIVLVATYTYFTEGLPVAERAKKRYREALAASKARKSLGERTRCEDGGTIVMRAIVGGLMGAILLATGGFIILS
ncbi:hypothetical protein AAMO2058_001360100 [Amorphochlora amoebiformis]